MPGSRLSVRSGRGVAVPPGGVDVPEPMWSGSSSWRGLLWGWRALAEAMMSGDKPCGGVGGGVQRGRGERREAERWEGRGGGGGGRSREEAPQIFSRVRRRLSSHQEPAMGRARGPARPT